MDPTALPSSDLSLQPRLIIHGGAGNISLSYPPDIYNHYRTSLITIVPHLFFSSLFPTNSPQLEKSIHLINSEKTRSALEIATYAVTQLENIPLFNAGHGAVFTRDGLNELEASVMVSRGHAKRGMGVMGLRHVKHPIQLAAKLLEHGDEDLSAMTRECRYGGGELDAPSAQGHTQLYGQAAEQLAERYGLEMVEKEYFFTQRRWDEHTRALEREKSGTGLATYSQDEYLPQGTVGAVAMDARGVVCVATSTGGITNKLTGRIGDTPCLGAGFWAEEWTEEGDPTIGFWDRMTKAVRASSSPLVTLTEPLRGLLADCLPTPFVYTPLPGKYTTTRSMAASGTGNGDSFLRTGALRTVGAMARFKPESTRLAVTHVAGPGGELQRSAGDRFGRTGEGEGGVIGIESAVVRDGNGRVVDSRSEVLMDFNCNGMFRAWLDDDMKPVMSAWTNYGPDEGY